MTSQPSAEFSNLVIARPIPGISDDGEDQAGIVSRLRRRKFPLLGMFVLTLGLVASLYVIVPVSFTGQANVILASPEPLLESADPIFEQKEGDPADLESQVFVLASFDLLHKVVSQPAIAALIESECQVRATQPIGYLQELLAPFDCHRYSLDPVLAAEYVQHRLSVSDTGRSRIITVSYSSPIPEAVREIPNAIVKTYIADKLEGKLDSRLAAVTWIRSETARLSTDLGETEKRIQEFRRDHGLVQGQNASLASEQLTSISQQLTGADAALSDTAARISQLNSGGSILKQDYASQTALVSLLRRQLEEARRRVAAGTDAETEIASLQRHADVQRELFIDLSKKANAIETVLRLVTGNARVVSYAQLPSNPSFPRKLPFVLGGLIASMGLGVGTALLLDRNDRSVRTRRGLEMAVGIPVLGYIPALSRVRPTTWRKIVTQSPMQDAVRNLYARCVLLRGPRRPCSILVTSAQPLDGKTFVTLALAHFAAQSGQRVLAIECDLRQPDFQRAFKLVSKPGLSDYLRGYASCEDVVRPSGMFDLDIIAAGMPAVDSAELISNGRIEYLLLWARSRYDLILIDSPPSQALMDASLLASRVEGVLFCARWGISSSRIVSDAVQDLSNNGARFLGVAIDRVNTKQLPLYEASGTYCSGYQPGAG